MGISPIEDIRLIENVADTERVYLFISFRLSARLENRTKPANHLYAVCGVDISEGGNKLNLARTVLRAHEHATHNHRRVVSVSFPRSNTHTALV